MGARCAVYHLVANDWFIYGLLCALGVAAGGGGANIALPPRYTLHRLFEQV